MSADLPTLGKPITTARTGRGMSPLLRRFALIATLTSSAALRTCHRPCYYQRCFQNQQSQNLQSQEVDLPRLSIRNALG